MKVVLTICIEEFTEISDVATTKRLPKKKHVARFE